MNPFVETDAILSRLRQEFIETSLECLESIHAAVVQVSNSADNSGNDWSDEIAEIQRVIHTVKGQGTTFDFPAVTQISHRMEDYMEVTPVWTPAIARGVLPFVDTLRDILESGTDPDEDTLAAILRRLPINAEGVLRDQVPRNVRALLVMPPSMQRKLVAQELASCGFHVITASTPVKAIGAAVVTPPNVILATQVLDEMSGIELLRVFKQIAKTRHSHMALMTSQGVCAAVDPELPEDVATIHKTQNFHENLGQFFIRLGLFGDIAQPDG